MNTKNLYLIGDVHGCYKTLLALINRLPKDAKICFVGDLIDRGENSKEVIEFIIENKYDSVMGNHEISFIESIPKILKNSIDKDTEFWLTRCGGYATIKSYEKEDGNLDKELLLKHHEYFKSLPHFKEYKNLRINERTLVVSHSHVYKYWIYRNYSKNSDEYETFFKTIMYSRFKSFDNTDIFNIYGHTPVQTVSINNYKANIDLGCVYHNKEKEERYLCALEFPSMNVILQSNME